MFNFKKSDIEDCTNSNIKDMLIGQSIRNDMFRIIHNLPLELVAVLTAERFSDPESRINSHLNTIYKYDSDSETITIVNITCIKIPTNESYETSIVNDTTIIDDTITNFINEYEHLKIRYCVLNDDVDDFPHYLQSTSGKSYITINTTKIDLMPEFDCVNKYDNINKTIKTVYQNSVTIADCTITFKRIRIVDSTKDENDYEYINYVFLDNWQNVMMACNYDTIKLIKELNLNNYDKIGIVTYQNNCVDEYLIILQYLLDMHNDKISKGENYTPKENIENFETIVKILMCQNPLLPRDLKIYRMLSEINLSQAF